MAKAMTRIIPAAELQKTVDRQGRVLVTFVPYNMEVWPLCYFRPVYIVRNYGNEVEEFEKSCTRIDGPGELLFCENEMPLPAAKVITAMFQYHADRKRRKLKL